MQKKSKKLKKSALNGDLHKVELTGSEARGEVQSNIHSPSHSIGSVQLKVGEPNKSVATSHSSSAAVQLMRIERKDNGEELAHFDADEEHPMGGMYKGDGYHYEHAGGSSSGAASYRRTMVSYQNMPAPTKSSRSGPVNYGAVTPEPQGGSITPNYSPFFQSEAAVDKIAYGRREGYSALISQEDLDGTMREKVADLLGLKAKAKKVASAVADSVRGGPSVTEGCTDRKALAQAGVDPRVTHYIATHTLPGLAETAASTGASLATGGISGMVQKGKKSFSNGGLSGAFALHASEMEEENRNIAVKAHNQSDLINQHPEELIDAVKKLRQHFASAAPVEGAKAIPGIGSVVSGVHKLKRLVVGLGSDTDTAAKTIHDAARQGHRGVFKVANLLGIPHELMGAHGGLEIIKSRLG